MHLNFSKVVAVVVTLSALTVASTGYAVVLGASGDGVSDYIYDPATGALSIDPDGVAVGGFQLKSASGIFTGDAATLPAGLFGVDTDVEIGVGSLNAATSDAFVLGNVVQAGLTSEFLLTDLTTARGSGGFGTPNRDFDLIFLGVTNEAPTVASAIRNINLSANPNLLFAFQASDDDSIANGSFSTTLVDSGPSVPNLSPSVDAAGNFSWDATGSPLGQYNFQATFTDAGQLAGSGILTVNVTDNIPEPATMALFGLALVGLGFIRRK